MNEIAAWARQYALDDPDNYAWCQREWPGVKGERVAAEMAYIMAYNDLPEWAVYIEAFESTGDGNYIFIHADPDAVV